MAREPLPKRPMEPGWWYGDDRMWHPPEARPPVSFQPREPGWTLGEDGLWYPPGADTPVPFIDDGEIVSGSSGRSGWWLGDDGKWHPPESRPPVPFMPNEPGWRQAADGWWYPPGTDTSRVTPRATAPAASITPRWKRLDRVASVLTVLFGLDIVFAAVAPFFRVDWDETRDQYTFDPLSPSLAGLGVASSILSHALLAVFLYWFWSVAQNNEALARTGARFGPGWAIAAWFIPGANLVIPYLIAQDLWRGSNPSIARGDPGWRDGRGSDLIGSWWCAWTVSTVAGIALAGVAVYEMVADGDFSGPEPRVPEPDVFTSPFMYASTALRALAALLAILVVRQLTRRQEACLAEQRHEWAMDTSPRT